MSFADAIRTLTLGATGERGRPGAKSWDDFAPATTEWQPAWAEVYRSQATRGFPRPSSPYAGTITVESLPTTEEFSDSDTVDLVNRIEVTLGGTTTDVARMLGVSRQMYYKYKSGTEPSVENKRRLSCLATFGEQWASAARYSLPRLIKVQHAAGDSVFDVLSAEVVDFPAAHTMLRNLVSSPDKELRTRLSNALSTKETVVQRGDIARALHENGKPVYVGDPDTPDRIIRIAPDGTRTHGQMVNRQFVPDD